jgi:hypothetical protein
MFMFLNLLHTFISSSGAKFSVRCHGRVVQFDPGYLSLTSAHIPNPSKKLPSRTPISSFMKSKSVLSGNCSSYLSRPMLGCDVPGFFVSTIADDRLVFAIQIVGLFNDLRFSSFLTKLSDDS